MANFGGSIIATFIQRKALAPIPGDVFEIKGTVTNLNLALNTFEINGLMIDFADVTPRNGMLSDGRMIEIKGEIFAWPVLSATEVEILFAGLGLSDLSKAHIEGYVIDLVASAQTFSLSSQLVSFDGANFVGGLETELANGVKVEVEGPIVNGMLQAEKVEFKANIKIEANVEKVIAGRGTLILQHLTGIAIQTDSFTFMDGFVGLNSLSSGNNLKIRGRRQSSSGNAVIATRIELIASTPDNRTIIQGPVDDFFLPNSFDI